MTADLLAQLRAVAAGDDALTPELALSAAHEIEGLRTERARAVHLADIQRGRAEGWIGQLRVAADHLGTLLGFPAVPSSEPPGWASIFDAVSAKCFALAEANKEVERLQRERPDPAAYGFAVIDGGLKPLWRDDWPPDGSEVWREFLEGEERSRRVVRTLSQAQRITHQTAGPAYWSSDSWEPWRRARWAPILTPP